MTGITPACKYILGASVLDPPYAGLIGDLSHVNDLCVERVALMKSFLDSAVEKLEKRIVSLKIQAIKTQRYESEKPSLEEEIACTQETLRAMKTLDRGYASELFKWTNYENLDWQDGYGELCPYVATGGCGCDLLWMSVDQSDAFKENGKEIENQMFPLKNEM